MDWIKKHTDTCIILTGVIGSFLWMNGSINDLKKEVADVQKEVAIIKTVLLLKNIMPPELAKQNLEPL